MSAREAMLLLEYGVIARIGMLFVLATRARRSVGPKFPEVLTRISRDFRFTEYRRCSHIRAEAVR